MTTTSEGWTAAAAVASVQDKNREIPWCWLRRRAAASLGRRRRLVRMITFLVILKKKQLSHGKLTVLSTIHKCGAIMYTKNAKFVPTNGSFKAHLDAENLYAKKSFKVHIF